MEGEDCNVRGSTTVIDYGIGAGAGAGQSASHHMTLSVGQSAFESVDQSVNHHMLVNQ